MGHQRLGTIPKTQKWDAVVAALCAVQDELHREVNPSVYSPAEFRDKIRAKEHFINAVISGPKLFLIGDEHELGRLA